MPRQISAMSPRTSLKRKASQLTQSRARTEATSSTSQPEPQPEGSSKSIEKPSQDSSHGEMPKSGSGQVDDDVEDQATSCSQKKQSTELPSVETDRKIAELSLRLTTVLPPGNVFPIRIGSELFQLSGASISSDGMFWFKP